MITDRHQAQYDVDGQPLSTGTPDRSAQRRSRAPRLLVTERDRAVLGFVALHRIVLAGHVQTLLGSSASATYSRLHALRRTQMLSWEPVFHHQPGCYQITRKGLELIGSDLPRPRIDLRCYRHDVGVAWLWLAARSGVFGPMRDVLAERRLRSHDGTVEGSVDPLGVRLGGTGPGGRDRLHYPDLILVDEDGRRVAVELELSSKGLARRERILAGYGADPRVDAVLYLVDDGRVGRAVRSSAARLGISSLVHVQRVQLERTDRAGAAVVAAERSRRGERSAGRPAGERAR